MRRRERGGGGKGHEESGKCEESEGGDGSMARQCGVSEVVVVTKLSRILTHFVPFINYRVSLSELQSSLEVGITELEENLVALRKKSFPCLDQGSCDNSDEGATVPSVGQRSSPLLHMPPIAVPVSHMT